MKPDQFTSGNLFINALISGGTDNVTLTILNTSKHVKKRNYVEIFKCFALKYSSGQRFVGEAPPRPLFGEVGSFARTVQNVTDNNTSTAGGDAL
tara:strand:+ start:20358 stop:20639 length:282 start_codon:yes stop_codon:yes gene_type:complete